MKNQQQHPGTPEIPSIPHEIPQPVPDIPSTPEQQPRVEPIPEENPVPGEQPTQIPPLHN